MTILNILLAILAVAYFMPTVIAMLRGHHNALAIFILNLLAGWSVVGWIAAAVWACTAVQRRA